MQKKQNPYYWLLFLLFFKAIANAQPVQLTLFVNPAAPAQFSKWNETPGQFQLQAINTTGNPLAVHIGFEFKTADGNLVAKTQNAGELPIITLQPGANSINAQNVFLTDYFTIAKAFENNLGRNGNFPGNDYIFCANALSTNTGQVISGGDACGFFNVEKPQAPLLIYPPDGFQICGTALTNIVFQWTPLVRPNFSFPFYYHFVLMEMYPGQSAKEALVSNSPLVEQFLPDNVSQFQWPENLIVPGDSQNYAWGVNLYDYKDVLIADYSYPFKTICRDGPKDTFIVDSVKNPVTTTTQHPTTTTRNSCSYPGYELLKGSEVTVGMSLDQAGLFPYPRAVPLRADGKDKDVVKLLCSGCKGTQSELPVVVRDDVGNFEWTLVNDKGSLNTPFDLKLIDSLAAEIARLLKQIKDVKDSIDAVKYELNTGLDLKKQSLQKQIDETTQLKKDLENQRDQTKNSLDSIQKVIQNEEKNAKELKQEITKLRAEIKKTQTKIDSLNATLKGGPGADEQNILKQIGDQRKALDIEKQNLESKEKQWSAELDNLQKSMMDEQIKLIDITNKYNAEKDKLEAFARQISAFETQLMKNAEGKLLIQTYEDWDKKLKAFQIIFDKKNKATGDLFLATDKGLSALGSNIPSQRSGNYVEFLNLYGTAIAKAYSVCDAGNIPCNNALKELSDAGAGFKTAIGNLVPGTFVLDIAKLKKLDTLKKNILAAESGLNGLKKQVNDAATAYQNAQKAYYHGIADVEKQRQQILDDIAAQETNISALEKQLKEMAEKRQADEDKKRGDRLKLLSDTKDKLNGQESDLQTLGDSLFHAEMHLKKAKDLQSELNKKQKDLNDQIQATEKQLNDLKDALAKLKDKKTELEKKLKELEKKKKELEAKLAELTSKKAEKTKGNKSAVGPIVYYIPPPMEDVIQDQKQFQDLKDSVARAEAELQIAYQNKEAVQGKLVKEAEKIAQNLIKLQAAIKTIADAEKSITKLEDDIAKDKTKKYQDYLQKQKEAQDNSLKTKAQEEKAQKEEEKAEADKDKAEKELEDKKQKVEEVKKALENFQKEFYDRQNEIAKEEEILSNARNTLNSYIADIQTEQTNLGNLEIVLSQLKNDLTRAEAVKKEENIIANIRAEISEKEAEIKLNRDTKLPALRDKIESAKGSVRGGVLRVNAVRTKDSLAMLEWKKKLEELRSESSDLIKKNEKYEGELNKLDEKKKKKEQAKKNAEAAEKTREELQEDIAKQVENDKGVKKKDDQKKEAEHLRDSATANKEKAENAIAESTKFKTKWIDEAENGLKNAKEKLKKAENDLREFLLKEFEKVTFEANIKIVGYDKVVDKWRSGDGKGENFGSLIYNGRVPRFTGKPAEDKSPSEPTKISVCNPVFTFESPPAAIVTPPAEQREPRTIALMYKGGKPIWPEWPVIKNNGKLLAKDVVPVLSQGTDNDIFSRSCITSGYCSPTGPIKENILDLGNYIWEAKDGIVVGYNGLHPWMLWQTNKVDIPEIEKPQEVKIKFFGTDLAADDEVKNKALPIVRAGVLLECSKDTTAAPEAVYKLQGRVVNGEHKGLPGEDMEFEVKLLKGEAKEYGFNGAALKFNQPTDGQGYGKVDFHFGKGFAEFEINIRWKRGGKVVEEEKMKAISPLLLKLHRFSTGAPDYAWNEAVKVLNGDEDATAAIAAFPKKDKDKDKGKETEKTMTLRGVAGLLNFERDFVNDETVEFTVNAGKKTDPDKDKTKIFGIGRTHVGNVKDKEQITLKVTTENKYRPVTRPEKDEKNFNGKKEKKFKIGIPSSPFVIIMDEEFSPNDPVNGSGRLGVEIASTDILKYLEKVTLEIKGVELNPEDLLANAGEVAWDPGDAGNFTLMGMEFSFKSLGILAQKGATLKGKVKHAAIPNPVKFEAELESDGNFLGSLDSLPEIEVKKFKLKEGTAFDIDFHSGKSPGNLEPSFKGLLIRSAKLEFPEVFNGANKTPTELEVTDFYVGSRMADNGSRSMGFGGKAALKGSFFNMGYANYNFAVQELNLEFENSALKAGGFKGELSLPIPFEGKVATEVNISGEGFSAKVSTERPVTIPKMGVSMTFLNGSGIEYNASEKTGKLTINAFMVTKGLGEIEIKGFEISSEGTIKAKEITLEKSLKFGSGFDLHAKSIGFSVSSDEISITVKGGFAFPRIGIQNISGEVTVTSGPSIDVKLTGGKIQFDYNPVSFLGEFKYTGREFQGKFDIGIKKILPQGIQGMLVVGNVETKDAPTWNYWYAELSVGVKIPIGQTGLVLLGLGGGLGYNYIPPIGATEGHPQQNDAFSFKAIMQMGTAPGGEMFAGRMEMVLVPGKFSLYGKCWLLSQKESLFGEGQLNLQWSPTAQVDGFLAMLIGVPDAKGSIFLAQGRVNFFFAGTSDFYIRTENVKASVFQSVNAEAAFDLNPNFMSLNGKIYYKLNKSFPLGIVTPKVSLNVNADAKMKYAWKQQTLQSSASFTGEWDVDLETPLGTADITSGAIYLNAELNATSNSIELKAKAKISYDVWIYKDTIELDFGYQSAA
jgi:DNA repair exonuclease SbcCD ATPase subunit